MKRQQATELRAKIDAFAKAVDLSEHGKHELTQLVRWALITYDQDVRAALDGQLLGLSDDAREADDVRANG